MLARRFGCLALLILLALLCVAQDTPKGGRIEGDIRNSSGLPIAGANAQLLPGEVGKNAGVSGPDGHFVIENVPEGRNYTLSIEAPGFRRAAYGANGTEGLMTPFSIQNGEVLKVKITLVPGGAVSGKVVDTDGKPITRIFVTVVSASRLDSSGGTMTNEGGQFRFTGLPDGDYYLIAERQPRSLGGMPLIADSPDPSSPTNGYADVDTWFPNSLDRTGGSILHVAPGIEVSGNTITLQKVQSFSLSGIVQDAITGKPAAGISIQPQRQEGRRSAPIAVSGLDGKFFFRSLPPGTYTFQAASSLNHQGEAPGSFARQEVLVRDANVSDVVLLYQPPEVMSGKVTVEGGEIADAGPMSIAMTERAPTNNAKRVQTQIKKDGTFEIRLSPSSYMLMSHFNEEGKGYFIDKIKFNGVDLKPSAAIDVPPGNGNALEVVLSKHGGKVTGTVTDDDGNPRSAVAVLVRPRIVTDPLSFWAHGVVTSDPSGRFQIVDLPPGDYYAATFNLDGVQDFRVVAEAIGRQSNGREEFTLSEDSTASVTLKVSR